MVRHVGRLQSVAKQAGTGTPCNPSYGGDEAEVAWATNEIMYLYKLETPTAAKTKLVLLNRNIAIGLDFPSDRSHRPFLCGSTGAARFTRYDRTSVCHLRRSR